MEEKELEEIDNLALLNNDDLIRHVEEGHAGQQDEFFAELLQSKINRIALSQDGSVEEIVVSNARQAIDSEEDESRSCAERCNNSWPFYAGLSLGVAGCCTILLALVWELRPVGDYDFDSGHNGPGNMTSTYSNSQNYSSSKGHMD
jgi:hypothetical protein